MNEPFPAPEHDHGDCLDDTLARARLAFERKGLRFTELRERVLREIAASHHASSAYDVLERLAGRGERLAPISVYRAIEALLAAGLVHRLESRNAYFACHVRHRDPAGSRGAPLVLVCDSCGSVAEVVAPDMGPALDAATGGSGFTARSYVLEVIGTCRRCATSA